MGMLALCCDGGHLLGSFMMYVTSHYYYAWQWGVLNLMVKLNMPTLYWCENYFNEVKIDLDLGGHNIIDM